MAIGRVNTGGAGLNFSLKPYATEAALNADTPSENTVGIVTTTAIGKAAIKATQPTTISGAAVAEGDVWILDGMSSSAAMHVSKKNGVEVWAYPLSCKQYVSGTWVEKTAKSYIGGVWVDWIVYVFLNGTWNFTPITGGWAGGGYALENSKIKITSTTGGNGSGGYAGALVDLTNINTLKVEYLIGPAWTVDATYHGVGLLVTDGQPLSGAFYYDPSKYIAGTYNKSVSANGTGTLQVDVSGITGSKYIWVAIGSANQTGSAYFSGLRGE